MNKLIIPAILVIFALWILLQLALGGDIFKNSLNYFILITIFFLFYPTSKRKIAWLDRYCVAYSYRLLFLLGALK
ncbi:hypothetical protein BMD_3738 [Priestia megaterium DSM 319]|uniref:Uncharacterized protein n=1 Tax=Priestia megaterium (strain DSM 319 / IMG 1521) TaxID=592022 RepID=D5DJ02_PRIM3|nr:hypothetical protein BMD_3738 [Priestia megaterium DSM 319]